MSIQEACAADEDSTLASLLALEGRKNDGVWAPTNA